MKSACVGVLSIIDLNTVLQHWCLFLK